MESAFVKKQNFQKRLQALKWPKSAKKASKYGFSQKKSNFWRLGNTTRSLDYSIQPKNKVKFFDKFLEPQKGLNQPKSSRRRFFFVENICLEHLNNSRCSFEYDTITSAFLHISLYSRQTNIKTARKKTRPSGQFYLCRPAQPAKISIFGNKFNDGLTWPIFIRFISNLVQRSLVSLRIETV